MKEIQKILDEPQLKVKECHEIRWLSFYEAVQTVYRIWLSLVQCFGAEEDKKALSKRLTDYRFVFCLHLLMDILPSLALMSLVLQKTDVDISSVRPALNGVIDTIKGAKAGSGHSKSYYQREFKEKKVVSKDKDGKVKSITFKGVKLGIGHSKEVNDIRTKFCDDLLSNIQSRFPRDSLDIATSFMCLQ